MKGYLFTAFTVLMFLSLFTVTYYFFAKTSAASTQDIFAEKTLGLFDDVSYDISGILQLSASVENGPEAVIRFDDRIPAAYDIPASVRNYSAFLEGPYAQDTNAVIQADAQKLSSSTAAVDLIISPTDYAYGYRNLSKTAIWLRNLSAAQPEGINLTIDASGEQISDIIWLEAENFTSVDGIILEDPGASADRYVESFASMNTTAYVPLALNYTLWVRAVEDNSSKNFTVEVDGRNSTRFDIRDYDSDTQAFKWFNDSIIVFNMTPGDKTIRVYPDPSSDTESVDVVLLTTKYISLPDETPFDVPNDPVEVRNETGGDLKMSLDVRFSNANYSYSTASLSRDETSEWNFTFDDGDRIKARFGRVNAKNPSSRGMLVTIDNSHNQSYAYMNTTASYPQADRIYIDTGCTLTQTGPITRTDRIWLAKG